MRRNRLSNRIIESIKYKYLLAMDKWNKVKSKSSKIPNSGIPITMKNEWKDENKHKKSKSKRVILTGVLTMIASGGGTRWSESEKE